MITGSKVLRTSDAEAQCITPWQCKIEILIHNLHESLVPNSCARIAYGARVGSWGY
jgi:hypothetical protein